MTQPTVVRFLADGRVFIAEKRGTVLFYDSRFWAEEGSVFFASFRDFSFFEAIRYTYLGSFLGLTNLTVWLSTLAPLEYAPAVTTAIALAFHTAVAFQIASDSSGAVATSAMLKTWRRSD